MHYKKDFFLVSAFVMYFFCSCSNAPASPINKDSVAAANPIINYSVTNYFQHDTTLYTEGFLFHDGQLFESTGSPDELPQLKSMVGLSDLKTGKFTKKIEIDGRKYFGEGIVFFKDNYTNLLGKTKWDLFMMPSHSKESVILNLPTKKVGVLPPMELI